MRIRAPKIVPALACFFFALTVSIRAELVLARKGQSQYRIVLAANAPPSERYAAEELQGYLEPGSRLSATPSAPARVKSCSGTTRT